MLRNEASATDETDASFLSMTVPIKKIGMYNRAFGAEELQALLFINLTLLRLARRLGSISPSP
jgi:hypothetical protein